MKTEIDCEKLKSIAEAPPEVKENWSKTQRFIARVIDEVKEEISEDFDGDVKNEVD